MNVTTRFSPCAIAITFLLAASCAFAVPSPKPLRVVPVITLDSVLTGLPTGKYHIVLTMPAAMPETADLGFYRKGQPEIRVPVICSPSPIRTLYSVLHASIERTNKNVSQDTARFVVELNDLEVRFTDTPAKAGRELRVTIKSVVSVKPANGDVPARSWTVTAEETRTAISAKRHAARTVSNAIESCTRQILVILTGTLD